MRDRPLFHAALVLALVLGLPPAVFASGPCSCDDVKRLERELENTRKKLEAWKKVKSEADGKTLPTAAWAKNRYLELWKEMFPGVTPVVVGQQNPGKDEVYVSDELKDANCDGIWKAVEAHELDHKRFDAAVPGYKAGWVIVLGQEGAQLARKEVEGHQAQVNYLENELAALGKRCSATPQRYQEQDERARAEALARVKRAQARVSAYAATIK